MSPGMPDTATVRRLLLALDEALQNLRHHTGRPLQALSGDLDERWAVERGLQLCAQCVLDICTHLAASQGRDVPDYASGIDAMVELGILPAPFGHSFRGVAGFRNVLVHAYLDVDLERVHRLLNGGLEQFAEFARLVHAFIAGQDE